MALSEIQQRLLESIRDQSKPYEGKTISQLLTEAKLSVFLHSLMLQNFGGGNWFSKISGARSSLRDGDPHCF